MKFQTRLRVTFAAIAVLPMILFTAAFFVIGNLLIYLRQVSGAEEIAELMPRVVFRTIWISIFVILVVIALVLTRWIGKGVFSPVNDLKIGMKMIADGNFDYALDAENAPEGEIGELYKNYEDMRLKLKENTEEIIQNENKNRELITNISHDLILCKRK